MSEPVLFDDGGSTRIKQLKGPTASGKLDDLLDKQKDFAPGPFAQLTISCLDVAGVSAPPQLGGAAPPLGTFPIAMGNNHTFKIFSGDHRVEGRIVNRAAAVPPGGVADCQVTVSGVNNIDPVIEARHGRGQRRYIVSNAPSIEKIDVNAAGPAITFTVPLGTVYTVVILS